MIIHHIQALRNLDILKGANVILIFESNLAFEGTWGAEAVLRSGIRDVCVMYEDDNRAGVRINKAFKKNMALALNYKLQDGDVAFYDKFVCTSEEYTVDTMKTDIINQLKNYSRILKPSNDIHKEPQEIYGGKEGYGFDDHVIALQINLIMFRRFFEKHAEYERWY